MSTKVIAFDGTGAPRLKGFANSPREAAALLGLHCYGVTIERVKGEGFAYVSELHVRARIAWNRPIITPQIT